MAATAADALTAQSAMYLTLGPTPCLTLRLSPHPFDMT